MLPEKRAELARRRETLKHERQQERLRQFHDRLTEPLRRAAVPFTLIAPGDPRERWPGERFPGLDNTRIHWAQVPGHRCVSAETIGDLSSCLRGIAAEHSLGNPRVVLRFADAGYPSFELRFDDLATHALELIDFSWDCWIYDPQGNWVLEYYHHGEWCWGLCPEPED